MITNNERRFIIIKAAARGEEGGGGEEAEEKGNVHRNIPNIKEPIYYRSPTEIYHSKPSRP